MKKIMSTNVRNFKFEIEQFMAGQQISLLVAVMDAETGEIKLNGAWDCNTEIDDCEIEVADDHEQEPLKYVEIDIEIVP